ncbi:hypothetical protein HMH01_05995 [Halovulum dunhuangense]|uniref:Excalibur calcium-binding domain-containing protein n=1 Tax=Halovulum dunhuangense TaxID=1505036 RepID=A0A849L120_9RHOB|nr:hypothetical protein [Halovulum dunhuangense]NNU79988.1 hypothetical protein [Halovulum dunhuangense]
MKRTASLIGLLAALAACDNSAPAGGQGYFDPPPPARFVPPTDSISTLPSTGTQPGQPAFGQPMMAGTPGMEGGPASALSVDPDPNAALARDVTAALQGTNTTTSGAILPPGAPPPPGTPVAQVGDVLVAGDMGIDPNDQSIDLNASSLEVQERQRAVAQQMREAAQSQLVVVEPMPVPQQDINANVVAFARETTHPVGTKRYNRPAFRSRIQSASVCRRFETNDEAQRQFLANGGPETDRFNLDPDGDGFACEFDPERYRRLQF